MSDLEAQPLDSGNDFQEGMFGREDLAAMPKGVFEGMAPRDEMGQNVTTDAIAQQLLYGGAVLAHMYAPPDSTAPGHTRRGWETKLREAADSLTPEPGTLGIGTEAIHGLAGFATQIAMGGGVGGIASAGVLSAYEAYHNAINQGIDEETATKLALGEGGSSALFAGLPLGEIAKNSALAGRLLAQTAAGVGSNMGIGAAGRYANHSILEKAGYPELAEQYKANDADSIMMDAGTGLFPALHGAAEAALGHAGAMLHKAALLAAADGHTRDAISTAQDARAQRERSGGIPLGPESARAHNEADQIALAQTLDNKPIDLSNTAIERDGATILQPPQDPVAMQEAKELFAQVLAEHTEGTPAELSPEAMRVAQALDLPIPQGERAREPAAAGEPPVSDLHAKILDLMDRFGRNGLSENDLLAVLGIRDGDSRYEAASRAFDEIAARSHPVHEALPNLRFRLEHHVPEAFSGLSDEEILNQIARGREESAAAREAARAAEPEMPKAAPRFPELKALSDAGAESEAEARAMLDKVEKLIKAGKAPKSISRYVKAYRDYVDSGREPKPEDETIDAEKDDFLGAVARAADQKKGEAKAGRPKKGQAAEAEPDVFETPAAEPVPKRNMKTPDAREDSVLQYLAKHGRGISLEEGKAQGLDPADMNSALAKVGIKRAFRKGGMSFDQAAEMLSEAGYPVKDEQGNYTANAVLAAIDSELRGKPVHSLANERVALEDEVRAQEHEEFNSRVPEMANIEPAEKDLAILEVKARAIDNDRAQTVMESWEKDDPETIARVTRQFQEIINGEQERSAEGVEGAAGVGGIQHGEGDGAETTAESLPAGPEQARPADSRGAAEYSVTGSDAGDRLGGRQSAVAREIAKESPDTVIMDENGNAVPLADALDNTKQLEAQAKAEAAKGMNAALDCMERG